MPVVTTLPVLRDFVEAVGGPHIRAVSLISGFESEHTYTPKPSDIILIRKARVLFKIGLGLEAWVAPLIQNANRPDLPVIITSDNVPLIEESGPHGHGDSEHHAKGNPHIWLDPDNAKIMIAHITAALISADPAHASDYRENAAAYLSRLSALEKTLLEKVGRLRDKKMITHHPAWPYFAKRFGFEIKGHILTQIGSEPSAKKMRALIRLIRTENIKVVVSEPQLNPKIPEILSEETDVTVVPLSPLPGALPGTAHYLDLIRYNVESLVQAFERAK
ncbi:MAG: metal ABC transporter substrate-binding protein [Nitrospiria bacterium]